MVESEVGDAAVGSPGLPPTPALPAWTVRSENTDLVVSDADGSTRLRVPGAPRYGWGTLQQGGNRDRKVFMAFRTDQRPVHHDPHRRL